MQMGLVPNVEKQPAVNLKNWAIFQLEDGSRFFVGEEDGKVGKLRTSTPITSLDETSLTGITESGRVYRLIGSPRPNPVEDFACNVMFSVYGIDRDTISVIDLNVPSQRLH
jgi:hypothetical protein